VVVTLLVKVNVGILGNAVAYRFTLDNQQFEYFKVMWKLYDAVGWNLHTKYGGEFNAKEDTTV
jgi:hypothetical protein